jgi:hypothetical protein
VFGRWVSGRWALGVFGRWVFLGVGCFWALGGLGRWVVLGVGWSRAATRSLYRDFDSTFGSPD